MSPADLNPGDGEEELSTDAVVLCPYCGVSVEIVVDPGGGAEQEYVEDCEVCCRPWLVHVTFSSGSADVWVEPADQ